MLLKRTRHQNMGVYGWLYTNVPMKIIELTWVLTVNIGQTQVISTTIETENKNCIKYTWMFLRVLARKLISNYFSKEDILLVPQWSNWSWNIINRPTLQTSPWWEINNPDGWGLWLWLEYSLPLNETKAINLTKQWFKWYCHGFTSCKSPRMACNGVQWC